MFEPHSFMGNFLLCCIVFLAATIFLCLIRAVRGPRFTDRIVASNMIGTMTIMMMAMLSVYFDEAFLVDVAIVYALLSFIAVLVICQMVIIRQRRHDLQKLQRGEKQ